MAPPPLIRRHLPELVLFASTFVWGATFLGVQTALSASGPLFFVGARFTLAAALLLAATARHMRGLTRFEVLAAAAVGVPMMLGYALQTYGLETIPSSKSAFITALYVPIVPLLQLVLLGRPPRLMSWIGVVMAFTGLLLLAGPQAGGIAPGRGELLTLASAVAISLEIIAIGAFAPRVDARRVATLQLAIVGALAFAGMPLTGEAAPAPTPLLIALVAAMAAASAAIQLAMNWAQRSVSPTRATLLYAGEPVWAGLIGRLAGERLPGIALVGAALIVASVVVSELRWPSRRAASQ